MAPRMPPMQIGPADLAARYIRGAYAWSLKAKGPWPTTEVQSYLAMVPPIPGKQAEWLRQFMHHDMSSPGLVKLLRENPPPDDLPEGKEIVILTTMIFDLQDHALAAETLRAKGSDFQEVERDSRHAIFEWTRKYPGGHWSPLALLGGRQSLGTVRMEPGQLTAEVKTLSMGTQLVAMLKSILGEQIRFREAEWLDPRQMTPNGGRWSCWAGQPMGRRLLATEGYP